MSIFENYLKTWGNRALYDNSDGLAEFIIEWEKTAFKKFLKSNSFCSKKNKNSSDVDPAFIQTESICPDKRTVQSNLNNPNKSCEERQSCTKTVRKLGKKDLNNIQDKIKSKDLLTAIMYCVSNSELGIRKVKEDYIELAHEREDNIFLNSEWLTKLYRLKSYIEENFKVNASVSFDIWIAKLILKS